LRRQLLAESRSRGSPSPRRGQGASSRLSRRRFRQRVGAAQFRENPLGPSPKAIAAVLENGLREANRYNLIDPLIARIARFATFRQSVVVGCGSTEFLQFTPWAFLKDGGTSCFPYRPMAGVEGREDDGPRRSSSAARRRGTVDCAGLKKAITRDTRMLYVANPNNPTGAGLPFDEIASLTEALPEGAVFFVDEAYNDFLPEGKSAIDLVRRGSPVLVTRTFSKGFGLAGLRLGYAIGSDEVLDKLKSVWWGDLGINTAVHVAAPAALDDTEHVSRYVHRGFGLQRLKSGSRAKASSPILTGRRSSWWTWEPARPLVRALRRKGIRARRKLVDMPTFLRVSVGTAEENELPPDPPGDHLNRCLTPLS
jgi:histidinol-phosphate aminotransferase